jgi:integrase/recombinase XerD
MTPLRKRMINEMVTAGLSANTQASYIQGVRALAAHTRRSPDRLTEAEVRRYLLYLRDERDVAHGTFQPAHAALQFLYVRTLDRDWALFLKKESKRQSAGVCRASCPMPRPAPSSAV